jgi:hypothetical protein
MHEIRTDLGGGLGRFVREIAVRSHPGCAASDVWKHTLAWLLFGVGVLCAPLQHADAEPITIAFDARVELVEDAGGFLGGAIAVGDRISFVYTYDSTTPDTNPLPPVGDYWHTTSPFGIRLTVNGLEFHTDPNDVSFLVEIVNDHYATDNYLLRSYNNVFDVSVPSPHPGSVLENHISWQLDDPTATALSSTSLPTERPVLADWQSIFGLDIFSQNGGNFFLIRAHVVPEPSTCWLLGTGLGGLLGYDWSRRRVRA